MTGPTTIFQGPAPLTGIPADSSSFMPVRHLPQVKHRVGFSNSGVTPYVDPNSFTVVKAGSGMSYSQSSSNLVLASGTTALSETILRSTFSIADAMNLKAGVIASQRIANCQLILEVVDVQGDGLAAVINSATSITVTFPTTNPFTTTSIGQSCSLGAYSGSGSLVPGADNAVVASISGLTTTFTVAGAATGSGTLSVFGLNYTHVIYDGTTATTAKFGTQRNGWPFADASYTINTTASPGHDFTVNVQDDVATFLDALAASSTNPQFTRRASIRRNMPDGQVPLVVQIRLVNLGTAPASPTTYTIPYVDIENYASTQVSVVASRPQSGSAPMPVEAIQPVGGNLNVTVGNLPVIAGADGIANTTTGQTVAEAYNFNGASWDRVRNNVNTATGDTGAKLATFNGATQTNYNARGAIITALLGTVTGTSPLLGLQLQWSPDGGTTWLNYGTALAAVGVATGNTLTYVVYPANMSNDTSQTLAAFTVGSTFAQIANAPLPRTWRVLYNIGGTSPSITLTGVYVDYIN